MKVEDIVRLVKVQLLKHGSMEQDTGRLMLTESSVETAVLGIAADLYTRLSRPVVTITRQDVLQAASAAGYKMDTVDLPGGAKMVVPVDETGRDVFDKVHSLSDHFVRVMLDRMPEATLRDQLLGSQS